MNNTVTANQFMIQQFSKQFINEDVYCSKIGLEEALISFAKYHVEAALRLAAEEAYYGSDCQVNRQNITNIYPLKLIK